MSSMEDDPDSTVALSYYDCLLRNEDVDLLRGSHWLNDAVIGFYFEYLQHTFDKNEKNLFVGPDLTQLLKLTDVKDYPDCLEPLNAKQRSYIFFPLNNCESRTAAGGSHWSLLVYSRQEQTSFHLDSCKGTNHETAAAFAKKMMNYLSESGAKDFEEKKCPQQENGYDCGLFALCLTDSILQQIDNVSGVRDCGFDNVLNAVKTKRKDLLQLIKLIKINQQVENSNGTTGK